MPNRLARGDKIDRVRLILVSLGFIAVSLICIATGLFLAYLGLRELSELAETADWNRVPCRVVQSEVRVERDSDTLEGPHVVVRVHRGVDASILKSELGFLRSAPHEYFSFDVLYEYSVAGHTYRSKRGGPSTEFSNQDPYARENLARLQTGASTLCWVNPSAPTESVFQRCGHASSSLVLAVGIGMFLLGCWMINFSIEVPRQ